MTSGVFVLFAPSGGVAHEEWEAFCAEHEIVYAPTKAGRNIYLHGGPMGIECAFGNGQRGVGVTAGPPDYTENIVFSTNWGGPRKHDLARRAAPFWIRFGGSMHADEPLPS